MGHDKTDPHKFICQHHKFRYFVCLICIYIFVQTSVSQLWSWSDVLEEGNMKGSVSPGPRLGNTGIYSILYIVSIVIKSQQAADSVFSTTEIHGFIIPSVSSMQYSLQILNLKRALVSDRYSVLAVTLSRHPSFQSPIPVLPPSLIVYFLHLRLLGDFYFWKGLSANSSEH